MIYEMNHVGIQVEDLDASLGFYQGVLGGRTVWSTEIAAVELDIVYVEIAGGLVELLHFRAPRPGTTYGIDHVAFLSDDLDADFAGLVGAGYEALVEPRTAGSGVGRNAFVADAYGNRVEILQRDLELRDEPSPNELVEAIDHVCVRAGDLDRAREFYHERMGLEILREVQVPGSDVALTYLAVGNDVVELLHTDETAGKPFPHLALRVTNVEAAAERLGELGVSVRRLPRPGDDDLARAADLVDPDGVRIEILDRPSLLDGFRGQG